MAVSPFFLNKKELIVAGTTGSAQSFGLSEPELTLLRTHTRTTHTFIHHKHIQRTHFMNNNSVNVRGIQG